MKYANYAYSIAVEDQKEKIKMQKALENLKSKMVPQKNISKPNSQISQRQVFHKDQLQKDLNQKLKINNYFNDKNMEKFKNINQLLQKKLNNNLKKPNQALEVQKIHKDQLPQRLDLNNLKNQNQVQKQTRPNSKIQQVDFNKLIEIKNGQVSQINQGKRVPTRVKLQIDNKQPEIKINPFSISDNNKKQIPSKQGFNMQEFQSQLNSIQIPTDKEKPTLESLIENPERDFQKIKSRQASDESGKTDSTKIPSSTQSNQQIESKQNFFLSPKKEPSQNYQNQAKNQEYYNEFLDSNQSKRINPNNIQQEGKKYKSPKGVKDPFDSKNKKTSQNQNMQSQDILNFTFGKVDKDNNTQSSFSGANNSQLKNNSNVHFKNNHFVSNHFVRNNFNHDNQKGVNPNLSSLSSSLLEK